MPDRASDPLAVLNHVLASAARITADLADDPLLPRLLDVFARIPVDDRETIINVLEREADLRRLSQEARSGALSGVNVTKPNPNARLYFRVADSDPTPFVTTQELVQSVTRAARIVHRASQRGRDFRADVGPDIVQGLRQLEPEERNVLRDFHRAILAMLDEAESSH